MLRDAILLILQNGHGINSPDVNLFLNVDNLYVVEVFDPLDDDTRLPLDDTYSKCSLHKCMQRHSDWLERVFIRPEDAVDFYLALIEEIDE